MTAHDLSSEQGVQAYLNDRFGSCTSVRILSGGYSAYVYRAKFDSALKDGSKSGIVKHVKEYAAQGFDFRLDPERLDFENTAMTVLPNLLHGEANAQTSVRFPQLLEFDRETRTIIMEDVGDVPTLKAWLNGDHSEQLVSSIGDALGLFLANVHDLSRRNASSLSLFAGNDMGRKLSSFVYFGNLATAAARSGYEDDFIAAAGSQAAKEVLEADEVLTVGDFWTGNVLVSTSTSASAHGNGDTVDAATLHALDFELAKPGTAAFDVGQMAAEMCCLAKYRDSVNGTALLKSFLKAYKSRREVDPAKVAIRIGAHFVVMGAIGWSAVAGEDAIKQLVAEGVELIKAGWKNDEKSLKKSVVAPLYKE